MNNTIACTCFADLLRYSIYVLVLYLQQTRSASHCLGNGLHIWLLTWLELTCWCCDMCTDCINNYLSSSKAVPVQVWRGDVSKMYIATSVVVTHLMSLSQSSLVILVYFLNFAPFETVWNLLLALSLYSWCRLLAVHLNDNCFLRVLRWFLGMLSCM
jgi:hypothetical protein